MFHAELNKLWRCQATTKHILHDSAVFAKLKWQIQAGSGVVRGGPTTPHLPRLPSKAIYNIQCLDCKGPQWDKVIIMEHEGVRFLLLFIFFWAPGCKVQCKHTARLSSLQVPHKVPHKHTKTSSRCHTNTQTQSATHRRPSSLQVPHASGRTLSALNSVVSPTHKGGHFVPSKDSTL